MVRIEINLRNSRLNIAECERIIGLDEISNQKSCPCIARSGIRDHEDIVVEDREISSGCLFSSDDLPDAMYAASSPANKT